MYEQTIYISHAYQGKPENIAEIEGIIKWLMKYYPEYRFISPVHAFGYLYNDMPYPDGLALSMSLLEICDEMWYMPSSESMGVNAEIAYCRVQDIPFRTIEEVVRYTLEDAGESDRFLEAWEDLRLPTIKVCVDQFLQEYSMG